MTCLVIFIQAWCRTFDGHIIVPYNNNLVYMFDLLRSNLSDYVASLSLISGYVINPPEIAQAILVSRWICGNRVELHGKPFNNLSIYLWYLMYVKPNTIGHTPQLFVKIVEFTSRVFRPVNNSFIYMFDRCRRHWGLRSFIHIQSLAKFQAQNASKERK